MRRVSGKSVMFFTVMCCAPMSSRSRLASTQKNGHAAGRHVAQAGMAELLHHLPPHAAAVVADAQARLRAADERALKGEVLISKLRAFIAQQQERQQQVGEQGAPVSLRV